MVYAAYVKEPQIQYDKATVARSTDIIETLRSAGTWRIGQANTPRPPPHPDSVIIVLL
jgi:hypothetical protein